MTDKPIRYLLFWRGQSAMAACHLFGPIELSQDIRVFQAAYHEAQHINSAFGQSIRHYTAWSHLVPTCWKRVDPTKAALVEFIAYISQHQRRIPRCTHPRRNSFAGVRLRQAGKSASHPIAVQPAGIERCSWTRHKNHAQAHKNG